jgi:hypothetical protein
MRTVDEQQAMIRRLVECYFLGGPPRPGGSWDAEEAHSYILTVLQDGHGDYDEFLRDAHLTDKASLQSLLRLVASSAAITALSWATETAVPELFAGKPPSADRVVLEALAIQPTEWVD